MQLKHLFVFLLVLVISVADSTIYAQESAPKYYQSSKIIDQKKVSYKNAKRLTFNKNIVFSKFFIAFFFPSIHQKNAIRKQIQLTIKLQKQLYQKTASQNIQHIFLNTKITSSNSNSNLYIA